MKTKVKCCSMQGRSATLPSSPPPSRISRTFTDQSGGGGSSTRHTATLNYCNLTSIFPNNHVRLSRFPQRSFLKIEFWLILTELWPYFPLSWADFPLCGVAVLWVHQSSNVIKFISNKVYTVWVVYKLQVTFFKRNKVYTECNIF